MRFARFEALVGLKKAQSFKQKTVMVVGLGGVGSFALEALARAGIGHLILVDHDTVDITNINRQLLALSSTVGERKVAVAERRICDINPEATIETYPVFLDSTNLDHFLDRPLDFIVDAIDSIDAKTALIEAALKKQIPIISAMGFAKKLHPEMIRISTLKATSACPLAKTMRFRLKNNKEALSLPVVYSTEPPMETIDPSVKLGSVSTVPSVAGLMMASYVINQFLEKGDSK